MTNGSRRISALESRQLALWPEESADPNDDRIVNQLMYVPLGYDSQNTPLKSIYLSASDRDWRLSLGRKTFLECPVSSCQLVARSQARRADLIFFKSRFDIKNFKYNRKPNQIWAKFEIESPLNTRFWAPLDSINWTITYRHDSEVSTPYYKFYPFETMTTINSGINYAANKSRKVAWFVSNCHAHNRRLQYARQLSKYIEVDIFGRCGTLKCSKNKGDDCLEMLDKDYKFYLSFENSNCFDYITEKFWFNGLMHNVIPVVMGAHPSTYRRVAPPHSYIHVDDFKSPEHLAKYLHLLDTNDRLYNQYLEWKGTGELKQIFMWCRICALLHSPQRTHIYHDLNHWWQTSDTCVKRSWTDMTISDEEELSERYGEKGLDLDWDGLEEYGHQEGMS